MSAVAYTPGVDNAPFGNLNTNPEASQFGFVSGFSPTESNLIQKAIRRAIFDAAPAQYNALKLVFSRAPLEKNLDDFEYLETTFGRSPLESTAIVGAVAAVPGAQVTQVIPVTAASLTRVTPDLIIIYPDNSKAVIKIIGAVDITVESQTSAGLSAVASGDIFAIQSTIDGDGRDFCQILY